MSTKIKDTILGVYSTLEYRVENQKRELIYRAGNHPNSAEVFVPSKDGVGLRKMRKYCIKTTKEIAKEQNANFGGVTKDKL